MNIPIARKGSVGELYMAGAIGSYDSSMISALDVRRGISEVGNVSSYRIFLNSPGGDVFEGVAIYHLLHRLPNVKEVRVDGLAASAASLIAMAGDTISVSRGSFLMLHKAWTVAIGNSTELLHRAKVLAAIDSEMLELYHARTGLPHSQLSGMLEGETWLTGSQAVELGFADTLGNSPQAAARFDLQGYGYKNIPRDLQGDAPSDSKIAEVRRYVEALRKDLDLESPIKRITRKNEETRQELGLAM